jgi:hypothetical protein
MNPKMSSWLDHLLKGCFQHFLLILSLTHPIEHLLEIASRRPQLLPLPFPSVGSGILEPSKNSACSKARRDAGERELITTSQREFDSSGAASVVSATLHGAGAA